MKPSLFLSALLVIPVLFSCGNHVKQNQVGADSIKPEAKETVAVQDGLIADTGNAAALTENKQVVSEKNNPEKKENAVQEKKEAKPLKKDEVKKVIVDSNRPVPDAKGKRYRIKSFTIDADILTLEITYRGGCGTHIFDLYSNGLLMKSMPPQLNVYLEHVKENETCTEEIKQTLKFDLSPLKKPGNAVIVINVNSADNKVEWKVK